MGRADVTVDPASLIDDLSRIYTGQDWATSRRASCGWWSGSGPIA